MAKTILEDISAFLAQQTSWVAGLPYDIQRLYLQHSDGMIFIKEQTQRSINNLENLVYETIIDKDSTKEKLNNFIIDYNKTLTSIKTFIASHKGEYLTEVKKIYTRIDKEHNWVVKELTGAAADRVDIRQELGYEISKRRSQDNALNTKIESEILDRIDKQTQLKSDLEASIATTNVNVSTLDAKISAETTQRVTQLGEVTQAIANEAVARNSADSTLQTNIEAINTSLTIEAATRLANDTQLQTLINGNKTALQNSISEMETRRISDLSILAARDNLEENETKKRDYNILRELREILAISIDSSLGGNYPLRAFSDGIYDWDQLSTSNSSSNTTGILTSSGKDKHGLLPNTIRKLALLQKLVTGESGDGYDTTPEMSSSGNSDIGLDFWKGSKLKTDESTFYYKDGTNASIDILNVNGTELELANDFKSLNILNNFLEIINDASTKSLTGNSVEEVSFLNCNNLSISTSTVPGNEGYVNATYFNGTATRAQYADLAERYEADFIYEPGTILAIGGSKEVTLYQSGMPLAGVVSTNPAHQMNDKSSKFDNKEDLLQYELYNPFVALKGRVPVKVYGHVNKGDYLLAYSNGTAIGVKRKDLPSDYDLIFIGIALADSIDNIVEVKV